MTLPPLHKSAALYLSWIGGLCGAIVLLLADLLPFPIPFATPGSFFASLVELEIFFVLLVWPLFVPSLLREGCGAPMLLAYVAALLLFALPLVMIGANVSSVGTAELLRSQALVSALAALGAGVAAKLPKALPWYLLGVFWVSAAHPFWFFLQHELGAKAPAVSVYISPFWGAVAEGAAPAWVQTGLFGIAGLLLLALAPRKAPVA
ncbi:MAG: hypothetical protein HY293_10780 [Planctomycetes bacterium]|nr:hypothetical protein [Planctomycetota bacterium]